MPEDTKEYYKALGVNRESSADDIKKAFRKMARKFHPDVAKDKANAEDKFKEINEAYEVLGDPEKRTKYDRLVAEGNAPGGPSRPGTGAQGDDAGQEFHFGGTGFSDFFEQYFSGGSRYGFPTGMPGSEAHGRRASQSTQRGADIEGDILVTLEEAMQGTLRPVSLRIYNKESGQTQTRTFQIRIPSGATDGRRIRLAGQGEPSHHGGPSGDLYLRLRHAAHPDFSSRGSDIFHELDIAPWEAVLGAQVVVPTLNGSIKLSIPAAAENGRKMRVRGLGLPKEKTGERGDYFVILNVVLPTTLNTAERAVWEKLRDTSAFHPRPVHEARSVSP